MMGGQRAQARFRNRQGNEAAADALDRFSRGGGRACRLRRAGAGGRGRRHLRQSSERRELADCNRRRSGDGGRNPARITDSEIAWRDAKDGWRYTLDRKTGKLTVVLASATGGNFLYDQCRLPK